jgi:ribosomal protein S27AE
MPELCPKCGKRKEDVEQRYSYGIYAGIMCGKCAYTSFQDRCGLIIKNGHYIDGQLQGAVESLDEFMAGGYDAIDGEG